MTAVYGETTSSDGQLDWSHAEQRLKRARNYWTATTRLDGTPHAVPVWRIWVEGSLYFGTSRRSVKGRNLAHSPGLVVHLESADDVVILEGEVEEVRTEPPSMPSMWPTGRSTAWALRRPGRRGRCGTWFDRRKRTHGWKTTSRTLLLVGGTQPPEAIGLRGGGVL